MSIAKLAHEAGMDPAQLELLEREPVLAAPKEEEIRNLASALGVTLEELV